jgi:hypothetical protein
VLWNHCNLSSDDAQIGWHKCCESSRHWSDRLWREHSWSWDSHRRILEATETGSSTSVFVWRIRPQPHSPIGSRRQAVDGTTLGTALKLGASTPSLMRKNWALPQFIAPLSSYTHVIVTPPLQTGSGQAKEGTRRCSCLISNSRWERPTRSVG